VTAGAGLRGQIRISTYGPSPPSAGSAWAG